MTNPINKNANGIKAEKSRFLKLFKSGHPTTSIMMRLVKDNHKIENISGVLAPLE